jgi:adenosine deaminase
MATLDTPDLEKVELHCHLDGLLNPDLLRQVNAHRRIINISEEALQEVCPVSSLRHWTKHYMPLVNHYLSDQGELLLEILKYHVDNLKRQHVIYTEVMLASFITQYDSLDQQMELFKQYREVADELEEGKIQIEFLIGIGRTKHAQKMEQKAARILRAYQEGYICGVALAGVESASPVKPCSDIFQEFQNVGLGIEIHAGEWCGPDSVWDALEYGFAQRIGHGLAVFDDPVLVKHVEEYDIHLEMCPTSNLILADVKSIEEHPVKHAIEHNLNHSINTDDPGPLQCTMNSEYQLISDTFGVDEEYFERVKAHGLRAGFAKKLRYV